METTDCCALTVVGGNWKDEQEMREFLSMKSIEIPAGATCMLTENVSFLSENKKPAYGAIVTCSLSIDRVLSMSMAPVIMNKSTIYSTVAAVTSVMVETCYARNVCNVYFAFIHEDL